MKFNFRPFFRRYSTSPTPPPENPLTNIFATGAMLSFVSYKIHERLDRIESKLKTIDK